MKALPPRITVHLRPVVRRLTILWIVAVVLAATMTISASYHARLVTGACWLALAGLSVYALGVLKHLRP
jgi:cell division protein FtsL